jgi:hypothetical protein
MNTDGKLYPVIPFNLIVDTDVGLLKLINDRYHNTDVFHWSLIDAPTKFQLYMLYNRKYINPLTVIAKDRDNLELMNDYYKQFIENEYVYILRHSVMTRLYNVIKEGLRIKNLAPTILCNSPLERTYLTKADPDTFNKCNIVVANSYKDIIDDNKDPIYFKYIGEILTNFNSAIGKNVFIPKYRFNYEDSEKTIPLKEPIILSSGGMNIESFDLYADEDMIKGH